MSGAQQIEKLRARAEVVLDQLIGLEKKYAMLKPLAYDAGLAERVGKGAPAHGHAILQDAMLEVCVLDLVKLSLDMSERAPSLVNIMATLDDEAVKGALRSDYTVVPPMRQVGTSEPLPEEVLESIAERERHRLGTEFDAAWERLAAEWTELKGDQRLQGFKTWRDKLIAHADLHHKDGAYSLTALADLKLKWGDMKALLGEVRAVVDSVSTVTRASSFAWDMLDQQLTDASEAFFGLVGPCDEETGAI